MASSSIKIALEMTGVQAYANATERAAQANEKLAERSKKSIAGIMSSTQRMVDMATKSKEQMTLEKLSASGASPEQIAQVKARFAQVEQVRAAEKAAAAAKAAEEQRAKDQAMAQAAAAKQAEVARIAAIKEEARAQMEAARQSAELRRVAEAASLVQAKELAASQAAAAREAAEARRAAEVAAAQRSKETQLKIHKQLMAEKAAADQKYQRTQQYADSMKSGPMFGKTLGPLLKGFVGFKAVDLGLGALSEGLAQLASGGKIDAMQMYATTVTDFVKGLPGGDKIYSIAQSVHKLFGGGPSAEEIQKQTDAMVSASNKRISAVAAFDAIQEGVSGKRARVGKSDDEIARMDREEMLANERKKLIAGGLNDTQADSKVAGLRRAMLELQDAERSAANAQQARQLDPALFTSMLQEQQQAADRLIGTERELYFSKVNRLVVERKITEDQENQLRAAYDKTAATRAELEQRKKSEESMKQQAELAKQMEQQATDRAGRMMGFSNVESLSTAIGGVKVAGMTSFSLERMMPTQEAMKLALQQIVKNTSPLAAGAP